MPNRERGRTQGECERKGGRGTHDDLVGLGLERVGEVLLGEVETLERRKEKREKKRRLGFGRKRETQERGSEVETDPLLA